MMPSVCKPSRFQSLICVAEKHNKLSETTKQKQPCQLVWRVTSSLDECHVMLLQLEPTDTPTQDKNIGRAKTCTQDFMGTEGETGTHCLRMRYLSDITMT